MRVCLITYDSSHLKTEEVYLGLRHRDCFELEFLFVPFTARPERKVVFNHRPSQFGSASVAEIAKRDSVRVYRYDERQAALDADFLLVCGANLLDDDFANSGRVINCHPGLIPIVRGLDSFKWSIVRQQPVGNTLHIIDTEPDSGKVLHHLHTPVYPSDTLKSFADRHYRFEILMLQNFDSYISGGQIDCFEKCPANMRMPSKKELELTDAFERYKEKYAIH